MFEEQRPEGCTCPSPEGPACQRCRNAALKMLNELKEVVDAQIDYKLEQK